MSQGYQLRSEILEIELALTPTLSSQKREKPFLVICTAMNHWRGKHRTFNFEHSTQRSGSLAEFDVGC